MASGSPPGLVKAGPLPWLPLIRPGLSFAGTGEVVGGTCEVLLGAGDAVWGCGEEVEPQSGVLGIRAEGSGSTDPVKLPL